jgi:hypothetical protein
LNSEFDFFPLYTPIFYFENKNKGFHSIRAKNVINKIIFLNNNKMKFRIEKDTMGEVQVPADKYWGAQTERSRNN